MQSSIISTVVAQRPAPQATEKHEKRVLALGNISFVDSKKPISTTGGLFQISLKKWPVNRGTNPDSLLAMIDRELNTKLAEGIVHPDIRRALRNQSIRIDPEATLKDSSGIWVLRSGRDRYMILINTDSLGVYASISFQDIEKPKWFLHLLGSGSLNGENDYSALGQIGLILRNSSNLYTAVGFAIHGSIPTKGIAPIIRLEIMDVVAFQGGPAYYGDDKWGYFVSVEFMKGLWEDIGLKEAQNP